MIELKVFRIDRNNPLPRTMTEGASGIDLHASLKDPVVLERGEYRCIPTGLIVSLPRSDSSECPWNSRLGLQG